MDSDAEGARIVFLIMGYFKTCQDQVRQCMQSNRS